MAPLVFVWLGSRFPCWGHQALSLARSLSGLKVVLICNKSLGAIDDTDEQYFVEDFYEPPSAWHNAKHTFSTKFRNGFWLKTTERFFVLDQFIRKYKIPSLFHAELDNLIFDISSLGSSLDLLGSGFFCPRDAITRGIASLIYINDHNALIELNQFALNNNLTEKNDMTVLGHLLTNSDRFFSLPTENAFQESTPWSKINPIQCHGIFDAAALGQFLFGIDPRNGPIRMYNGVQNENRGCDLWRLNYLVDVDKNNCMVTNQIDNQSFKLFNLHIHSKLFSQLTDSRRLDKILTRIHNGQTTLMNFDLMQNRVFRSIKYRLTT